MKQHSQAPNNLRYERKRHGWSQGDVADKIGGHSKTVSRWERGLSLPNPYYQQKLAEIFEKSVQELGLLDEQEQQSPESQYQNQPSEEDWRDGYISEHLYGREKDLARLERWMIHDRASIALISGIGGIGKTSLALTLSRKLRASFSYTFWYSLQAAPPFTELIASFVQAMAPQQHIALPEEVHGQVAYLMTWLHRRRTLLILDNFESVLQSGKQTGTYLAGYEGYGLLLRCMGSEDHHSCLLLTSREIPREFLRLQGNSPYVFSLQLDGIGVTDGQKMLANQGLVGSETSWTKLVDLYSGNPLSLKLIAGYVREIFGGDIEAFLHAETTVFGNIYDLLEQQFQRLSDQEQEIVYWLAIEHQPISFQHLWHSIVHRVSRSLLLDTLDSLRRRFLIETGSGGRCFLQPVVAEYIIEKLIQRIYDELDGEKLHFFRLLALTSAWAREHVRSIQARLILAPIVAMLVAHLGQQGSEHKLKHIIALLRTTYVQDYSYAAANLLHLLIAMQANLRGLDCSSLTIQYAYLSGVDLPTVDFSHAHLLSCAFTDTFGSIYSVAFSSDGSLFAVSTTDGEIRVWRTASFEPLATLQGHADGVRSIAFSPTGHLLASGSVDQTVRLWNVFTGTCQQVFSAHSEPVRSIAFHPEGQMLASGSEDRCINLWDVGSGQLVKQLNGHNRWICTLAFSPNGETLLSGSEDGTLKLWRVDTGQCITTLQAHAQRIRSVAYSSQGDLFVSGGDDTIIKVWNAHSCQLLHSLQGPAFLTRSIALSHDSTLLAAGGDDQVIYLWETRTGRSLPTLQGHTNRIWSLAFHPDNQLLLSGSEDQTVRLWDTRNGQCQHTLQGYRNLIWSVAFSPDNTLLSSGSDDGVCRIWETDSGRCIKTLRGHTQRVRCTAFSPDGKLLASCGDDLTLRLWDVTTGQCLHILRGHTHLIRSLAFHPAGTLLVSGSHDKSVRLWDVHTGDAIGTLPESDSLVWSVDFSPDGRLVASGSDDHCIRIWDVETRSCLALFRGHTHRIWSVAFSPDGTLLASCSDDQTICLWRLSDGACLAYLHGHTHWVRTIAFSPDGKTLVSGSHDNSIRVWDVNTHQCNMTLRGHQSWIWSVCFSSDGKNIASGSDNGTIKIWHSQTGTCLTTMNSERPYEGLNITGVKGLTEAQQKILKILGAIEYTE